MTEIFDCYVEKPTKEEAIEIVERAVANGVVCFDAVAGMDVNPEASFYEYDEFEYWGISMPRGTYTNYKKSRLAKSATKLTMDEYRAKFPCEKYDGKSDEWPKAGAKCEVLNDELISAEWEECEILFIGKFKVVYNSESCNERIANIDSCSFRPINTDRERFIEAALNAANKVKPECDVTFAGALYDAGFKAPDNNNENT